MKVDPPWTNGLLIGCYGLFRRTGILRLPPFRWLFEYSYFLYKKRAGDPYSRYLNRHDEVSRSGHILDVGANIGYMTALFRQMLSPQYRVYAFEPESRNFASLRRRFSTNEQVVLVQAAVGDQNKVVELWENPARLADHRVRTPSLDEVLGNEPETTEFAQVNCVSLDAFLEQDRLLATDISLVKIDVQGFEIPVLKGMSQMCQTNPDLQIGLEYDPLALTQAGFSTEALGEVLNTLGLQAHTIDKSGELSPVSQEFFVPGTITGHTDLLCKVCA